MSPSCEAVGVCVKVTNSGGLCARSEGCCLCQRLVGTPSRSKLQLAVVCKFMVD